MLRSCPGFARKRSSVDGAAQQAGELGVQLVDQRAIQVAFTANDDERVDEFGGWISLSDSQIEHCWRRTAPRREA